MAVLDSNDTEYWVQSYHPTNDFDISGGFGGK
jgi:hypothetical protein